MGQWEKLLQEILAESKNLRFDDLRKALERIGYVGRPPRSGSSHWTFRKNGCPPITIPKQTPLNRAYIELVSEAVCEYLEEDRS